MCRLTVFLSLLFASALQAEGVFAQAPDERCYGYLLNESGIPLPAHASEMIEPVLAGLHQRHGILLRYYIPPERGGLDHAPSCANWNAGQRSPTNRECLVTLSPYPHRAEKVVFAMNAPGCAEMEDPFRSLSGADGSDLGSELFEIISDDMGPRVQRIQAANAAQRAEATISPLPPASCDQSFCGLSTDSSQVVTSQGVTALPDGRSSVPWGLILITCMVLALFILILPTKEG